MRRLARFLFHATAAAALSLLLAPDVWRLLANDNDPRTKFGTWSLILHKDDQIVIRTPNDSLWKFSYSFIYTVAFMYVAAWLLALILMHSRSRKTKRQ
jgi:hypothetical protein